MHELVALAFADHPSLLRPRICSASGDARMRRLALVQCQAPIVSPRYIELDHRLGHVHQRADDPQRSRDQPGAAPPVSRTVRSRPSGRRMR